MQSLCADDRPCLHFFPGMGFRPAVHVLQRDQYGDRLVLVIGDDGPIEGKVVPGYSVTEMSFDPYAVVGASSPILTGATPTSTPGSSFAFVPDTTSSGRGGYIPGTSFDSGETGNLPDDPRGPKEPFTPEKPLQPKPPIPGIDVPGSPDLPPLAPVPLPSGGALMLSVVAAAVVLRCWRGYCQPT